MLPRWARVLMGRRLVSGWHKVRLLYDMDCHRDRSNRGAAKPIAGHTEQVHGCSYGDKQQGLSS